MASRFIPYQGGSRLFVGAQGGAGLTKGLDRIQAKLARLPAEVVTEVREALSEGCDAIVDEMKAIAPASDLEPHPGALKEAIRKETGRHELSFDITCNPEDAKGRRYGAHVEFGHYSRRGHGKHTPAEPFFFTAYKHQKKALIRRLAAATSRAVKRANSGA